MYMQAFRCNVTGATGTVPIGNPKPPVYCADDDNKCVKGPKQMMVWNQLEGNNFNMTGIPYAVTNAPGYNSRCGFTCGTLIYVSTTAMTDKLHQI